MHDEQSNSSGRWDECNLLFHVFLELAVMPNVNVVLPNAQCPIEGFSFSFSSHKIVARHSSLVSTQHKPAASNTSP